MNWQERECCVVCGGTDPEGARDIEMFGILGWGHESCLNSEDFRGFLGDLGELFERVPEARDAMTGHPLVGSE